jgi:hypothetical protein
MRTLLRGERSGHVPGEAAVWTAAARATGAVCGSRAIAHAPKLREASRNIFVGNLAFAVTEEALSQLCASYGEVASGRIMTEPCEA